MTQNTRCVYLPTGEAATRRRCRRSGELVGAGGRARPQRRRARAGPQPSAPSLAFSRHPQQGKVGKVVRAPPSRRPRSRRGVASSTQRSWTSSQRSMPRCSRLHAYQPSPLKAPNPSCQLIASCNYRARLHRPSDFETPPPSAAAKLGRSATCPVRAAARAEVCWRAPPFASPYYKSVFVDDRRLPGAGAMRGGQPFPRLDKIRAFSWAGNRVAVDSSRRIGCGGP